MAKIDSSRIYIAVLIGVPKEEYCSSDIHRIPQYLTADKLFKSKPVQSYPLSYLIAQRQPTTKAGFADGLCEQRESFFSRGMNTKQPRVSLQEYCRLESEEGKTHYWNAPNRGLGLTAKEASDRIRNYCHNSDVEVVFEVDMTVLTEAQQKMLLDEAMRRPSSMSVKIPPEAIRMAEFHHIVRLPKTEQAGKVMLLPLKGVIPNSDIIPPVTASPAPKGP